MTSEHRPPSYTHWSTTSDSRLQCYCDWHILMWSCLSVFLKNEPLADKKYTRHWRLGRKGGVIQRQLVLQLMQQQQLSDAWDIDQLSLSPLHCCLTTSSLAAEAAGLLTYGVFTTQNLNPRTTVLSCRWWRFLMRLLWSSWAISINYQSFKGCLTLSSSLSVSRLTRLLFLSSKQPSLLWLVFVQVTVEDVRSLIDGTVKEISSESYGKKMKCGEAVAG